jgi:hypothetical protein
VVKDGLVVKVRLGDLDRSWTRTRSSWPGMWIDGVVKVGIAAGIEALAVTVSVVVVTKRQ